ncbi:LuxR C-terminal-related transcriptional regulator [Georgenia sp. TF02-10]|uniref:LuxR C-terminal-related transcriptional regulator n=1 Tax=Georgenia sp. TF02-10 TaxID=2917725 RepID=UPI001FA72246|nr:LuxR C-terminal-related transcriptional regulator [Georgenia sp. TF02-10]UNX54344.1 LuxR C-terminal-related transcriptional regulator [Georgenia sp. TF02-10]
MPTAFAAPPAASAALTGLPPLVVLQAPRGYGKTTTVSAWLRRPELPDHDLVWLTVPASAAGREQLWSLVLGGLDGDDPPPGPGPVHGPGAVPGPGPETVAAALAGRRRHLVLVLDSYERQPDHAVDSELVQLAQTVERLHLVVLTRTPRPLLPLALAAPDAVVLGPRDLALGPAEVLALTAGLGRPLTAAAAERLSAGLAGWPGAIRVALLSGDVTETGTIVTDPAGLAAYLRVVLGDLEIGPAAVDVLTALAVSESFTPATVEELLDGSERAQVESVLGRMLVAGLLRQVPGERSRFAYSPLLRAATLHILREDAPARHRALHARAAERARDADDATGALRHAIESEDPGLLACVLTQFWRRYVRDDLPRLRAALALLPEPDAVGEPPVLAALRSQVRPTEQPRWFLDALRSGLPVIAPGSSAVAVASPAPATPGLPAALVGVGTGLLAAGELLAAAHSFYEAVRQATSAARALLAEAGSGLAVALVLLGHLEAAQRWQEWATRRPTGASAGGLPGDVAGSPSAGGLGGDVAGSAPGPAPVTAELAAPGPLTEVGRLAVPALTALDRLEEIALPQVPPRLADADRWLEIVLVYVWALQGLHGGRVSESLLGLERYRVQTPTAPALADVLLTAVQVDLCIAAEEYPRAGELLAATAAVGQPWWRAARARLDLFLGEDERALSRTEGLERMAPVLCRTALRLALVRVVAAHRTGRRAVAADALHLATAVAEQTGMLRPFVLVPRGDLEAVAATMQPGAPGQTISALAADDGPLPRVAQAAPLSAREIRVLRELATGRPVAVIARRLYVSESTVKTQMRSIYRKLGVHSREDAVRAGRRLRLVPAAAGEGR